MMKAGDASFLLFLVGCSTVANAPPTVPAVPVTKRMDPLCCPRKDPAGVAIDHGRLAVNGKTLTPEFKAIDSFDVSTERREIVFSAKRDASFDVGLVSLDGSDIHWVPEDPADEVDAQWAPRGHKISFIIRRPGGDLVRTVHVPTSTALTADFPYAVVRSLAWDTAGERYSVVLTSPDASERVESLKYDGGGRQTVIAPDAKLDLDIQPVAGGLMLRPALLRYNEKLPLVVWVSDEPRVWNDARGALMKNRRMAMMIVKDVPAELPKEVWIDQSHLFVVGGPSAVGHDPLTPVHTRITSGERYRVNGKVIEVPSADVESFASGWIAQQIKGSQ